MRCSVPTSVCAFCHELISFASFIRRSSLKSRKIRTMRSMRGTRRNAAMLGSVNTSSRKETMGSDVPMSIQNHILRYSHAIIQRFVTKSPSWLMYPTPKVKAMSMQKYTSTPRSNSHRADPGAGETLRHTLTGIDMSE